MLVVLDLTSIAYHRRLIEHVIKDVMMTEDDKKSASHKKKMERQKASVDASIAAAAEERGVCILLTGDGKGKTSSGFGMVMRALGYGHKVGVVQFIKGEQLSGEELWMQQHHPADDFYQMGTGFTWDTQNRSADIAAAERTWAVAERMLSDASYNLVLLDEMTYMLAYKYLDEGMILDAVARRPREMSVVMTGRGGGKALRELCDTVSEVKDIKHAYKSGIKARQGVDY